jgi:hypothetical protein
MTLLLSLVSSFALLAADAPECDPKDPTACAAPVEKGQPAPLSGQVLTPTLAIKLGQKADRCDAVTALEVGYTKKLADVDLALEKQQRAEDNAAHLREMAAMQKALDEVKPPFYERPWFVATVTGVVVAGGFALAVWGAGQLR